MEFLSLEMALHRLDRATEAARSPQPSTPATATRVVIAKQTRSESESDRLRIDKWPGLQSASSGSPEDRACMDMREAVRQQVQACLNNELASSTVSSYQAVLSSTVTAAEHALALALLPMNDEQKFLHLFGYFASCGSRTLSFIGQRYGHYAPLSRSGMPPRMKQACSIPGRPRCARSGQVFPRLAFTLAQEKNLSLSTP